MFIQEAMKTSKSKLARKGWTGMWLAYDHAGWWLFNERGPIQPYDITPADLTADNWETVA